MRVTRRLAREEDAAVAVIVAIALVVIFGMLALTLDLGRAVAVKRDLVNAADAAALAGAQQCALGNGIAAAEAAARQTATLNGAGPTVRFDADPECADPETPGAKTVRVTYSKVVDYYIAPVLGFDSITVEASATAIWGPAGSARPVPFVAEEGIFQGPCDIPRVARGTLCPLWFDNDDFEGSTFGVLNLNMWDVDPGANCASKDIGDNQHYAYVGGYPYDDLSPLNYTDPTWVCAGDGNYQPVFLDAGLANNVDGILSFPVTDGCIRQGGKCDKFNVVGFARLQLVGVWKTNEAPAECGEPPSNSSSHCILTRWVGGGFGQESSVIGGVDFGLREIRLVE